MTTWILVADAARARLFDWRDGHLHELESFSHAESRLHGIAFTRERSGRVQESASSARHGVEPATDPRQVSAAEFARTLAERLQRGRVEHAFQQLVLVAPPRFLGHLRGALSPQLASLVTHSIDKDLSSASSSEIAERLQLR